MSRPTSSCDPARNLAMWLADEHTALERDVQRLIAILAANRLNAETDAAVLTAGGAR